MAAVTVTAAKVGVAFPASARIRSAVGGAALSGGNSAYIDTGGLAQLCTSADATHGQFAGIAIPAKNSGFACGVGQACNLLQWGEVEGFDLSGVAFGALIYVADDGTYATTAGTKTVPIGKVVPTTELDSSGNYKKLLMIMVPFTTLVS